MKYVYVLTSTENDFYYEQFFMSAVSLKERISKAEIVLLCDFNTEKTLSENRRGYEKIVSQIIPVKTPENMLQVEISRWIRTSMRRFVKGDFLFLDGDTIVAEDLSSVAGLNIGFGACLDSHTTIDRHANRERFIKNDKKLGFNSHLSNRQYNGGVLFCADLPQTYKIFDRWHELWLFGKSKNTIRDQPSLNMAIFENSSCFTELDGTWNCQIVSNYLPYISGAKIFHYFATNSQLQSSPFLLASENIFKQIKETGLIPGEAYKLIENPKAAFSPETRIITDENIITVIDSDFFKLSFLLNKKMPKLFKLINCLSSLIKNITRSYFVRASRKKDGGIRFYN
ncbi:MAG: hypothetical protein LBH16_12000 [Treponema sp.]|jgi:hypothetical protein|nr:hypothetical protein [Treponema sp.]